MGNSSSEQQLNQALHGQYQVESQSYLLHKRSKQACTLHKITTHTQQQANLVKQIIEEYSKTRCQSISQLRDHYNVDNSGYCSNEQNFYLIFQGKNNLSLRDEYVTRKNQQMPFKQHEVQHIVETYLCGLREYSERFKRNFNRISLDSIGVDQQTRKIVLKDPYLDSTPLVNQSDSSYWQFVTSYPSPEKLHVAYHSKTGTYEEFESNLFSVGAISLQILYLNSMDTLYSKKKQVNAEQVRNRTQGIRDDRLRRGIQCLLDNNPNQRKKVYQIWGIDNEEEHFLQPIISPLTTERDMIQNRNKPAQNTYPNPAPVSYIRRDLQAPNRQAPVSETQQNWQQVQQFQRVNNPQVIRRYSPPASNLINQRPSQNIRVQQPSKNRSSSVSTSSNIRISFADNAKRPETPSRQINNNTTLPHFNIPNIGKQGNRKEQTKVNILQNNSYNPYSFYTNPTNSLDSVNRSQNLQIKTENPAKATVPLVQKKQVFSFKSENLTKPFPNQASPLNYNLVSVAQKQQKSPVRQNNQKPIQKNSQTPSRPTNKYKHNSTIVQAQYEDSIDRTYKSDNKAEMQYVVEDYQTGSKYEGYKSNGMRNGIGKFYYQDGGYYEGRWKNNRMQGYGKLYYNGGKLAYEGNWVEDEFDGAGKVYNDNPNKLSGPFDYTNFDLLEDYWQYYEGNLSKDTKQGRGKIKLSNGETFEGDFHLDRIQGLGKFYCADGRVIEGIWKQSKLLKIINNT